jgi:hypothetical protein
MLWYCRVCFCNAYMKEIHVSLHIECKALMISATSVDEMIVKY